MKKKVFVLILALFVLMPVSGVFAEEIDRLEGILINGDFLQHTDFNERAFDNNSSTFDRTANRSYKKIMFNRPIDIEKMFINIVSSYGANISFYFYNDQGIRIDQDDIRFVNFTGYYNLNFSSISEIWVIRHSNTGSGSIYDMDFFGSPSDSPLTNIFNVITETTKETIKISWTNPIHDDFEKVKILFNGNEYYTSDNYMLFEKLMPSQSYEFLITTIGNGKETEPLVFDIVTDNIEQADLSEIRQVNAESSHDRVDLSWSLPETEYFEHVNIYRKSVSDVQTFSLLSVDEYDPLFETNGTYFNDLTVEEQTTYEYKLTTEYQGLESEGVTVQATTLVAPPPELGGQEFEEQENGDYLVTWQQPETGQVRILIDGQEYVVVPATDKQYTIPAADMKYSALGDPLVGLQTIGDNGEESEVVQQESNVNLPFGINELLTTSAGLMRLVSGLILLGLSFILVPKFVKMIKQSLSNKKNAETERTEREQRVSERAYREPRESRISTREGRTSTRVPRNYRKGE